MGVLSPLVVRIFFFVSKGGVQIWKGSFWLRGCPRSVRWINIFVGATKGGRKKRLFFLYSQGFGFFFSEFFHPGFFLGYCAAVGSFVRANRKKGLLGLGFKTDPGEGFCLSGCLVFPALGLCVLGFWVRGLGAPSVRAPF